MGIKQFLLSLSTILVVAGVARAQDLSPCGVVASNVKLTASCNGPMVIAANNITIDLAGHAVWSDEDDSILMKDRSGVVIKNGSIGGRGSVRIQGGRNNALRELSIVAADDGGPLIIDTRNSVISRINFRVDIDAGGVLIAGRGTKVSESTFETVYDARKQPLLELGAGAIASRNTFLAAAQGQPSIVVKAGAQAESNTIQWEPQNVYPPAQSLLAAVVVEGDGAVVRSNSIRISGTKDDSYSRIIAIRVDGSRNTIKGNNIVMPSPDVASVGILIAPESKKNIIQGNHVSVSEPDGDVGIQVLGSHCRILNNKTDSVVVEGPNNISRRNVADAG